MSTQAGRLKGKRKRKRAKAMERCILALIPMNEDKVPKTSMQYRLAVANFFKCVTATQISGARQSSAPAVGIINNWVEEKLRYYNLPYLVHVRMIPATIEYAVDIQFIGAMDRQDILVEVLHI